MVLRWPCWKPLVNPVSPGQPLCGAGTPGVVDPGLASKQQSTCHPIGCRGICSFCVKIVVNCHLLARLLSNPRLMPGYSWFVYHHEQILQLLENEVTMKSANTPLMVSDNACWVRSRRNNSTQFAPRRAIASSSSRERYGVDVTRAATAGCDRG